MIDLIPTHFKTFALAEESVREERKQTCEQCEHIQKLGTCGICHCFMFVKTKFEEAKCPVGKW